MVNKRFLLDEFSIEPGRRELKRGNEQLHLANRPFQVLLYLIERRGQLVTRRELLDRFWQGRDVYDETLTKCVGAIRRVLNDRQDSPRFIETRYSEGYKFIGPLHEQILPAVSSTLEIEKTRSVRILLEEEEVHETQSAVAQFVSASVALVQAISGRTAALIVTLIGAAILTIFLAYQGRARLGFPPTVSASAPATNSVAVLPFKNLSGDAKNDYLSDGVTESLINELSKNQALKVISRASAFTYKNKDADAREVGHRLNVAHILEGSLSRSGDRIRINLRLISTTDGRVEWTGDSFDRALSDIFKVQDEISTYVAENLQIKLRYDALHQHYTDNVEAYQAYLRGRYFLNKRNGDEIARAIECFQQAIALDPHYALAYAGLADSFFTGMWFVPLEPKEARAKAKAAATKALALDDKLAEAHAAMSSVYFYEWNWTQAGQELERAIALNPGSADLHHQYSLYLNVMKRPDEAIHESQLALELDPLSLVIKTDLGLAYFYARRYDEAIETYKKLLDMEPQFEEAHYYLGESYMTKGLYSEALTEFEKTTNSSHGAPVHLIDVGLTLAYAGQTAEAQKTFDRLTKLSQQEYVPPDYLADFCTALGQKDQAFYWLNKAYEEDSSQLVNLAIDQSLDPLRLDPRFKELIHRVGLPE